LRCRSATARLHRVISHSRFSALARSAPSTSKQHTSRTDLVCLSVTLYCKCRLYLAMSTHRLSPPSSIRFMTIIIIASFIWTCVSVNEFAAAAASSFPSLAATLLSSNDAHASYQTPRLQDTQIIPYECFLYPVCADAHTALCAPCSTSSNYECVVISGASQRCEIQCSCTAEYPTNSTVCTKETFGDQQNALNSKRRGIVAAAVFGVIFCMVTLGVIASNCCGSTDPADADHLDKASFTHSSERVNQSLQGVTSLNSSASSSAAATPVSSATASSWFARKVHQWHKEHEVLTVRERIFNDTLYQFSHWCNRRCGCCTRYIPVPIDYFRVQSAIIFELFCAISVSVLLGSITGDGYASSCITTEENTTIIHNEVRANGLGEVHYEVNDQLLSSLFTVLLARTATFLYDRVSPHSTSDEHHHQASDKHQADRLHGDLMAKEQVTRVDEDDHDGFLQGKHDSAQAAGDESTVPYARLLNADGAEGGGQTAASDHPTVITSASSSSAAATSTGLKHSDGISSPGKNQSSTSKKSHVSARSRVAGLAVMGAGVSLIGLSVYLRSLWSSNFYLATYILLSLSTMMLTSLFINPLKNLMVIWPVKTLMLRWLVQLTSS